MRKLDPQLEFLVEGGVQHLEATGNPGASFNRFGLFAKDGEEAALAASTAGRPAPVPAEVDVLVRYADDPEQLAEAGLKVRTIAGDVLTGSIALAVVPKLAAIAEVEQVEAARAMHAELDLSIPECRANLVHVGPPGRRGAGVIVGICDSGCDFTHPSFRRADGTSRILLYWAQGLTPQGGETAPAGFGYGVEYSNAQINAALATANPFDRVRHRDPGGHGTHVTGIAAGDGSAPGLGRPAGTFVGVAPEADIIIVANASNGAEGLGTSASTLDAVNYMFQQAQTLGRPCVVNMSLGDNLGPHDGTSLLERGLDNLLGGPGRAFVKSAGNVGSARAHADGTIVAGATADLRFNQPAGDTSPNQIDIWYRGSDRFRVSVVDPAGNATGVVNVGNAQTFTLPGGNTVRIDHRNNDPFNGDRRIFMTLAPGAAGPGATGQMRSGNWTIRLVSVASPTGGRFDAWIQRGQVVPGFLPPHENNSRTISTPGTAREVITAANYVTRGAGVGSLASSSSRGPTRDGRAAPTIAAPGQVINSADGESSSGDPYQGMGGTSMAAPHVVGAIALLFQKNPRRTQDEIKACLTSSARTDEQTGPVPNTAWGAGKLDVNAAVKCVPAPGVLAPGGGPSVMVRCAPSVPLRCPSVIACPAPSVAAPCASVAVRCPSVPRVTCLQPSVIGPCPSAPVVTCGGPRCIVGCATVVRCPSVIDGCPSAPGGCNPGTVVINPTVPVNPALGGNPGVVNPGLSGGGLPGGDYDAGGPLPPGWDAEPSLPQPEVPSQGYFDYDESWFDDDGRGGGQ